MAIAAATRTPSRRSRAEASASRPSAITGCSTPAASGASRHPPSTNHYALPAGRRGVGETVEAVGAVGIGVGRKLRRTLFDSAQVQLGHDVPIRDQATDGHDDELGAAAIV